jgi:hypothetical protein
MTNPLAKLLLAAALTATAVSPAAATSVTPLTNEEVLATADSIIVGTVLSSSTRATGARGQMIVTDYVVRVDRVLSDDGTVAATQRAGNVTLTFAGGDLVLPDGQTRGVDVHGVPKLEAGDQAFFFLAAPARRGFTPLVGMHQGLMQIRTIDGVARVTQEAGCCERDSGDGVIRRPFMAKLTPANFPGFTPEEFAAQIISTLPKVREIPGLRRLTPPLKDPRGTNVFQGDELPLSTIGGNINTSNAASIIVGAGPGGWDEQSAVPPAPAERTLLTPRTGDETTLSVAAPYAPRYGFTRAVPNLPIVFNIPPALNAAWNNGFNETLGYWNFYGNDVFRRYTNPNNTLGANNSRNETGFLSDQQMRDEYNYPWGATTFAVCISWSVNNRIVESDIMFNPAWSWTNDRATAYGNASTVYFQTVSLHEQGHAFGRSHSWISNPNYGSPSVMNYWSRPFYLTEAYRVFADDAESIRAAYPDRVIPRNDAVLAMWSMQGSSGSNSNLARDLVMSPTTVQQGASLSIQNMHAENAGTAGRDITADFYLCPVARSFSGAIYAGSSYVGNFPRFSSAGYSRSITVPAGTPPGQYYVATAVNDDYNFNSQAWSQNRVTVVAPPPPPGPSNDFRANAWWISQGTWYGATTNATVDGSASCGNSNATPDIWYRIQMPYSGRLEVDSCGSSYDTVVSLYYYEFGVFFARDCDDDSAPCGANASLANDYFGEGSIAYIRVSGYNGNRGNVQINVRAIPANDTCEAPATVGAGTWYGNTTSATASNYPASCHTSATGDIWYSYTPSCAGLVVLDTIGSNFDTVLSIYEGCGGAEVTCNDDSFGGYQSQVSFYASADVTYSIRLGGYLAATGNTVLHVYPPQVDNDLCAAASTIGDGTNTFDTRCATTQGANLDAACGLGDTPVVADVWYYYVAPTDGAAYLSFCDLTFDAVAAIYDTSVGCPADGTTQIVCGVTTEGCPASPTVSFNVSAGVAYWVRIGGYYGGPLDLPSGTGSFTLTSVPGGPANDSCGFAQVLASSPATAAFDGTLVAATNDGTAVGDPELGAGPDVWYTWTAPCEGTMIVNTCGTYSTSGVDTLISLHSACPGTPENTLNSALDSAQVACELHSPQDAEVTLGVTSGQKVLIRIAAQDPAGVLGAITGSVRFIVSGDEPSAPVAVANGATNICTNGALVTDLGDGFEWADTFYVYQPGCLGTATASICAAPIETRLAIYKYDYDAGQIGAQLGYTYNDGPVCPGAGSSLTIPVTDAAYYIVRVGSQSDAALTLELSCTPDAAPCAADFNQDGGIDGADVDAFFEAWVAADVTADVDQNGGVDGSDVDAFFLVWSAGGC